MALLSQYNVVKTIGEDTWVFNTLTSAFVKLSTNAWSCLPSTEDKQLLCALERQGIVVEDHKVELDKYRYIYYKKLFDNHVLAVTIAPTMQCNFGCTYCFEGEHKTMPKMQATVAEAVAAYIIKQSESKEITINWFGGEPLLAFDVICQICDRLNAYNVDFSSSMVTNGSLLDTTKIAQLSKLHLTHLQITLDGTAHSHNNRRFYKGGRSSFDDIIRNIGNVLSLTSLRIVIQVGVDNTNLTAFEDVHRYIESHFPNAISDGRIVLSCNNIQNRTGFDCTGQCLTDRQLFDREVEAMEQGRYPQLMGKLPGRSLPCMYRRTNQPAIDPEGNIYHCLEHLGRPSLRVGNICKGTMSFAKIAEMAFVGNPFDDEECRRCNVLPVCGGGCPQDITYCTDRTHKTYCSPHKQYLADMLPHLYRQFVKAQNKP